MLKFGIPKGSLHETTINMLKKIDLDILCKKRSYFPSCSDQNITPVLMRSQEIGKFVEEGFLDIGIAGIDWIKESDANVKIILPLNYSKSSKRKIRWILSTHNSTKYKKIEDFKNETIYTELPITTEKFFKKKGVNVTVKNSWGATEAKIKLGACNGVVDAVETGKTLKENNLKEICTILESYPVLFCNKNVFLDPKKLNILYKISEKIKKTSYYTEE